LFGAQDYGSNTISRTPCVQRQAAANLAAHCSASSLVGTSLMEKPPVTAPASK